MEKWKKHPIFLLFCVITFLCRVNAKTDERPEDNESRIDAILAIFDLINALIYFAEVFATYGLFHGLLWIFSKGVAALVVGSIFLLADRYGFCDKCRHHPKVITALHAGVTLSNTYATLEKLEKWSSK